MPDIGARGLLFQHARVRIDRLGELSPMMMTARIVERRRDLREAAQLLAESEDLRGRGKACAEPVTDAPGSRRELRVLPAEALLIMLVDRVELSQAFVDADNIGRDRQPDAGAGGVQREVEVVEVKAVE